MDEAIEKKAARVSAVIMDVDGVLTDGKSYCQPDGSHTVAFDVHDGSGIKYLGRAGLRTAFITGRTIRAVKHRAETLDVDRLAQGAKNKLPVYRDLREDLGCRDEEVCYAGDDLPDLPVMREVGFAVAVSNARPEVRDEADMVTDAPGGGGAVRELAEFILRARGDWDSIMERYRP